VRRLRRSPKVESAKVIRVDLHDELRAVEVESRYQRVMLVVMAEGTFLGQVLLPRERILTAERQWDAITRELDRRLWRRELKAAFLRATRSSTSQLLRPGEPSVSVIICTRDRPQDLRSCLASLTRLRTTPSEVIVVDNGPRYASTRGICRDYPVRYLVEPFPGTSRARNRGIMAAESEIVAFVDDDCVVDPGWLDGLSDPFDDPLVMAMTGFAGPLELETRAQYLFEVHGGFKRHDERRVFNGASESPARIAGAAGAGVNSFFRRRVFQEVGLFAEDLGPGTRTRGAEDKYALFRVAEAGYRIVFDPARVVWHRHRRDNSALRRTLFGYAVGEFAYATRCLLTHRDPLLANWCSWPGHLGRDLRRLWRGDERAVPMSLILAEAGGIAAGPWSLWLSVRSRRRIPALAFPERPSALGASGGRTTEGSSGAQVAVRESPNLSVAIASLDRRELLHRVLAGLAGQSYPSHRFEAVVVLDGSTDDSWEMVRGLEMPYRIKLLTQSNRGLAASRNRGAREASHPVVVFLDDDIVPERDFLAEHAGAHQHGEGQVALGYYPPILERPSLRGYLQRAWWEDHFRRKAEPDHQWTFVDFVDGNCSMSRRLLFSHGAYDEDFKGSRRQDWEFGMRLLRDGVSFTYLPRAKGWHYLDTSFATGLRNARQEGRWDILFASKHPHLKAQLPLARAAGLGPRIPTAVLVAYRLREAAASPLQAGVVALRGLERLGLRREWRRLAHRLRHHSYLLGMVDGLPMQRFEEFFAPVWEGKLIETVPVWLDAPGSLQISAGAGAVELRLGYAGTPIAAIRAIELASQWDWSAVTEKVVAGAEESLRAGGPPRGVRTSPLKRGPPPPMTRRRRSPTGPETGYSEQS
jgi:glycosyltransferase involved in cell wall biosynthesis